MIIEVKGCDDCPFRNDYPWSTVGSNPTCNINDDKEIDLIKTMAESYRPDWCKLNLEHITIQRNDNTGN